MRSDAGDFAHVTLAPASARTSISLQVSGGGGGGEPGRRIHDGSRRCGRQIRLALTAQPCRAPASHLHAPQDSQRHHQSATKTLWRCIRRDSLRRVVTAIDRTPAQCRPCIGGNRLAAAHGPRTPAGSLCLLYPVVSWAAAAGRTPLPPPFPLSAAHYVSICCAPSPSPSMQSPPVAESLSVSRGVLSPLLGDCLETAAVAQYSACTPSVLPQLVNRLPLQPQLEGSGAGVHCPFAMQATCSTACSGVVPARQSGTPMRVSRATARPRCAPRR